MARNDKLKVLLSLTMILLFLSSKVLVQRALSSEMKKVYSFQQGLVELMLLMLQLSTRVPSETTLFSQDNRGAIESLLTVIVYKLLKLCKTEETTSTHQYLSMRSAPP